MNLMRNPDHLGKKKENPLSRRMVSFVYHCIHLKHVIRMHVGQHGKKREKKKKLFQYLLEPRSAY